MTAAWNAESAQGKPLCLQRPCGDPTPFVPPHYARKPRPFFWKLGYPVPPKAFSHVCYPTLIFHGTKGNFYLLLCILFPSGWGGAVRGGGLVSPKVFHPAQDLDEFRAQSWGKG